MKLFLMRHAHAEEGARDDAKRGLTKKGREQCDVMRQFIKDAGLKFDHVLCSMFKRAIQTERELKLLNTHGTTTNALSPSADVVDAWEAIQEYVDPDKGEDTKLLVITHHPLIEKLVSSIAFGFSPDVESFAHCTLLRLDTHPLPDEVHPLRWIVTPNLANRLQEAELIEAAGRVQKHLGHAEKSHMVDPLIAKMADAIARRFRSQARTYKRYGSIDLPPTVDTVFRQAFRRLTKAAYESGAWYVEQSLDGTREAQKPKRTLPGYDRDAEDLEDEIDQTSHDELTSITYGAIAAAGLSAIKKAGIAKLNEWTQQRTQMIALNEISKPFHAGGSDVVIEIRKEGRHVERHWDTQDDPCELCQENEEAGWIGEDEQYPNFPEGPPGHPNCQCSESYRIAGGEE